MAYFRDSRRKCKMWTCFWLLRAGEWGKPSINRLPSTGIRYGQKLWQPPRWYTLDCRVGSSPLATGGGWDRVFSAHQLSVSHYQLSKQFSHWATNFSAFKRQSCLVHAKGKSLLKVLWPWSCWTVKTADRRKGFFFIIWNVLEEIFTDAVECQIYK